MPDCGGVPGTQRRALCTIMEVMDKNRLLSDAAHLVGDLTALQIIDDRLCVLVTQVVEVQPKHMSHARLQDPEAMYPVVSGGGVLWLVVHHLVTGEPLLGEPTAACWTAGRPGEKSGVGRSTTR